MAEAEWQERHREIEELHRTILARMDENDRRAAEREKERAEQRAALDSQLRVGQGASSEPAKIDLKKWTETWDRFSQLLESKFQDIERVKAMAEPEWKGPVDRLDEVTIVQARILERLEQKYDDAIRRHDEELAELRRSQITLHEEQGRTEQSLQTLGSYVQVMSATVNGLAQTVDQFIRGKEGNGRKQ